jgi:hypothetical protein
MAKTYFGYQPQAREATINWSDIANEVSSNITGALQERTDKKEAIKQASREYIKTLNDVEQGQHATATQWWLQASHQAQENSLMQDRLLQDGHIGLQEYTMMRQNLVDGTDRMIKVYEDFQTTYADKLLRAQGSDDKLGESQKLESWAFEQVQNFFNFNESSFLINPETGSVSIGKLDPDGKVIADPSALRSASTFNAFVNMSADKYDLEGASATYVDELGTWDEISRKIGSNRAKGLITKMRTNGWNKELSSEEMEQLGLSIDEGELFNVYLAGEDLFVSEVMANPYHTSSILTNSLGVYKGDGQGSGEVFTFTTNQDDAGGNVIYVSQDNAGGRLSPEYTEEQEELVKEAIRTSVRNKVDVEVVSTQVVDDYKTPSATELGRQEGQKFHANALTNVRKLYSGSETEFKEAEDFLRSINPSIQSITRSNTGVVITYADSQGNIKRENLDFSDNGQLLDERAWVTGTTNFFLPQDKIITNVNETITASGLTGQGALSPTQGKEVTSATTTVGKQGIRETIAIELPKDIESAFATFENVFIADDETQTKKNVQSVLATMPGNFAFTVEERDRGMDDVVGITYKVLNKSGKVVSEGEFAQFDLDGMTTATQSEYLERLKNQLVQFYLANASVEQQASDFASRRGTVESRGGGQQGELDIVE